MAIQGHARTSRVDRDPRPDPPSTFPGARYRGLAQRRHWDRDPYGSSVSGGRDSLARRPNGPAAAEDPGISFHRRRVGVGGRSSRKSRAVVLAKPSGRSRRYYSFHPRTEYSNPAGGGVRSE